MDEVDAAVADHFLGPIPQDRLATRTDLDDGAPGIQNQDQVLGALEDLAALLDLLAQCLLGLAAFGDVARDLGRADDLT